MNVEQELGYLIPIGWKGKLQAAFLGKGFDSCASVLPSQRSTKALAEGVLEDIPPLLVKGRLLAILVLPGVQMFFQDCCRCLHWKKC